MAPPDKYEFVILKLTFLPHLNPQNPRITLTHKKYSPGGSMLHVGDWFDRIMALEKSNVPPNLSLSVRYTEWHVTSGNDSLFTVRGHCFDKVLLVLGEEFVHFVYYQNTPLRRRIEGCQVLTVNYCGCCLHEQYLQIMDSVKKCFNQ